MCTDLRLVRLKNLHVSGRTMDFADQLQSRVQVVPAGLDWSATETGTVSRPRPGARAPAGGRRLASGRRAPDQRTPGA
jgi:hypothetical protein